MCSLFEELVELLEEEEELELLEDSLEDRFLLKVSSGLEGELLLTFGVLSGRSDFADRLMSTDLEVSNNDDYSRLEHAPRCSLNVDWG